LFATAVAPINKSKSLIILPFFLSFAFSFANILIPSKIGRIDIWSVNFSTIARFFSGN